MAALRCPLLLALLPLTDAATLPRCTIAVAGANGRLGSLVCRQLLRSQPDVRVVALVRTASDPLNGYGRLSYEVGAEDGKMQLAPAWQVDSESGRLGAPATVEFDPAVQGDFGLERLELRECDLCVSRDVETALSDVDGVIYCASSANSVRSAAGGLAARIGEAGLALFEFRLGDALFGKTNARGDAAFQEEARGKSAEVEGLDHVISVLKRERKRRESIAQLTGKQPQEASILKVPFAMATPSSCFTGEVESKGDQCPLICSGDELLRASDLPHIVLRSATVDDRVAENLPAQMTDTSELATKEGIEFSNKRIHPRDLAACLVTSLATSNSESSDATTSKTVRVWTA